MLGSVIEGGANGVGEDPRMLLHDEADAISPMAKMISETLSMKFFIVSSRCIYCQYRLVPDEEAHLRRNRQHHCAPRYQTPAYRTPYGST